MNRPLEVFESTALRAALDERAQPLLSGLEILADVDSTNLHLLRRANSGVAGGHACLAEQQHSGRGRRGRRWLSPSGGNIYLSVLWRFAVNPAALGGISLALGVAVARSLQMLGIENLGLKWPNDVLWQGRKLAGILVDTAGGVGACHVVAGVGLNVAMPTHIGHAIDQPWVDVQGILGRSIGRNHLAGVLLGQVLLALHEFESHGLRSFLEEWALFDVIIGKQVALQLAGTTIIGRAQGIHNDGELRLCVDGLIRHYHDGEVSLLALHQNPAQHLEEPV